jgi:hypothetical protein
VKNWERFEGCRGPIEEVGTTTGEECQELLSVNRDQMGQSKGKGEVPDFPREGDQLCTQCDVGQKESKDWKGLKERKKKRKGE